MKQTEYSLTKLWPEFERLLTWDVTSPEGLSALFVLVLIAGVLFFSSLSIWNFWKSNKHLKYYLRLLDGLTAEELLEKRRDLSNKALENRAYGRLWREFDESLVHVPQKQRLCNTLDAAHFFNTHTMARGLTENRLLAAVPGFLTAIGVIGTFAGLQLGLGGLAGLDPAEAKAKELTAGIFGMIGGASIAFMTSVWGVFTSVLFNFFEKFLERNIRASITSFQNEVDYLYPRITAEQSLSNIEDFSRQSTEKLAELDEKIGHRMQEAMREASGAIREGMEHSLNTILGPAIEKLVDNAHSGSEKALETLLERFLEGVGSAGDTQKAMMEQAAKDISEASGGMTAGLVGFAAKLDGQIETMVNRNSEILTEVDATFRRQTEEQQLRETARQQELTAGLNDFVTDLSGQMEQLANQSASTMTEVQTVLTQQVEDQQAREISRQKILHDQLKNFQGAQEQLSDGIGGVLESQQQQNNDLTAGLTSLIDRLSALSSSHENATQAMQLASSEMKASSNQLGLLSGNVKDAALSLGEKVGDAVVHAEAITQQNSATSVLFSEVAEKIQTVSSRIEATTNTLNSAAERADSGLSAVDRHFDQLSQSLQKHVQQLEEQVATLLGDYSERVQSQTVSRLNTWNEQTNTYIGSMTDAVRALNDVVDEIDGKVRTPREASLA